jgi:hypothetical protein
MANVFELYLEGVIKDHAAPRLHLGLDQEVPLEGILGVEGPRYSQINQFIQFLLGLHQLDRALIPIIDDYF